MRISPSLLLCLSFLLASCHSAAASNPLIGTWITADNPIPAGCSSKVVFSEKTMYFESPAIPNLMPASKGTVNILYGGDPNQQKLIVVENPSPWLWMIGNSPTPNTPSPATLPSATTLSNRRVIPC